MKKLTSGKLKNLNDLVIGASVLKVNGNVGFVRDISDEKFMNFNHETCKGDIASVRATIDYPCGGGQSYYTYRVDGRTTCSPDADIVCVVRPEDSRVKSIKVYSDQVLTMEMIKFGNKIAELFKLYVDTGIKGSEWIKTSKPIDKDGFMANCKLTKSGLVSVKVWKK